MSPAFSSTKQAGAFAVLLLFFILLPALAGRTGLPPRSETYSSIPLRLGPFPFIHQQIFEDKSDVDIAFVGSSHIWDGIDTPYVQKQLSDKLGRKATVISLGWPWPGFDALYFILQDLLQHRKVHMLVIYDECRASDAPHRVASRWFRFGDNSGVLAGLPVKAKASLYAAAILGMPRNLLCFLRPNLPADASGSKKSYWESFYHAPSVADRMGALSARIGFDYNPDFVAFAPRTEAKPSDVTLYSPETIASFRFTGPRTTPYQLYFARKVAALAQEHGVKLVILHFPDIGERHEATINEREFWPDALSAPVAMAGIPPARLFAGMKDEDVLRLYYDPGHFNKNGQEYFTPFITPRLMELYDFRTNNR